MLRVRRRGLSLQVLRPLATTGRGVCTRRGDCRGPGAAPAAPRSYAPSQEAEPAAATRLLPASSAALPPRAGAERPRPSVPSTRRSPLGPGSLLCPAPKEPATTPALPSQDESLCEVRGERGFTSVPDRSL
ncbi:hypothetical protein NDU88_004602 [Pleurodeles waltl]|uniref:Uncharacterized protein n=1 Tax=Pleurodeles waltl TaxID=8319 RepID=A0AAV7T8L6_PLEWA|nr:hypothetical protein NDU88_004602 [Pleurodeles waltl]